MNAIPQSVLVKLQQLDPDDIAEITPICKGDRVYVCSAGEEGEVVAIDEDYTIELDSGETVEAEESDLERQDYDRFPMWSTMWQFKDSSDEDWARSHLSEMAACGFRLYESEDYGLVFGIDAAGMDFYEAFWIPLYKARGLRWHDKEV